MVFVAVDDHARIGYSAVRPMCTKEFERVAFRHSNDCETGGVRPHWRCRRAFDFAEPNAIVEFAFTGIVSKVCQATYPPYTDILLNIKMPHVFLSYASTDYFFAEMLAIKLTDQGIGLWRDQGQLRAGNDWRSSIEQGIANSSAVILALSAASSESHYVTYEWAYALGMGKPLVLLRLNECRLHPKLEPIQYLDFSYPKALPWDALIDKLKEIDAQSEAVVTSNTGVQPSFKLSEDEREQILEGTMAYLAESGYRMVSFDRLRIHFVKNITNDMFNEVIAAYPKLLRTASLKGKRPGLAKLVP